LTLNYPCLPDGHECSEDICEVAFLLLQQTLYGCVSLGYGGLFDFFNYYQAEQSFSCRTLETHLIPRYNGGRVFFLSIENKY
jgi:hypothetical protein